MHLNIEWLPAHGAPEQLIVLLHGVGASGADLAPLAQALRSEFPQAAVLAPDAPHAFDGGGLGRQWFSVAGVTETNRVERVAAVLPGLRSWLQATQQRLGVGPAATALGGFSQGAILALETVQADDGLVGRVLAFSGRYVQLPEVAPRRTTLHLFHGGADPVIAASHSRQALERLGALNGDATLDVAEGVGHQLHPVLVERALFRLRNHIPARTWAAALGAVPGLPSERDDH
jgi:phospholipase/carboxylesterase